jgi:hypothetical protein
VSVVSQRDLEPNSRLLLGPKNRQGLGEAGEGEVRRRGATRRLPRRSGLHEGPRGEQADLPFTLSLTLGNLCEGGNTAEPDVDPSPSFGVGGDEIIMRFWATMMHRCSHKAQHRAKAASKVALTTSAFSWLSGVRLKEHMVCTMVKQKLSDDALYGCSTLSVQGGVCHGDLHYAW